MRADNVAIGRVLRLSHVEARCEVLMRFGLAVAVALLALLGAAPAWADPPPPGLVAAYAFDETSGTTAVDASGNGRTGVVVGRDVGDPGRYGGALSFDGSDDYVGLPALGTFYNSAFTLEAWVQKATTKSDVGIVGTWAGSGPMLWVDHLATRHHLTLGGSFSSYLDSGVNPSVGQWQHLAATFDGSTARYYVDGAEVASARSRGASATRTPGGSVPTAASRAASSTGSSTRSGSTTGHSARARSWPTETRRSGS